LNLELNTVLSWNFIQLLNNSNKGPVPLWYTRTVETIATRTGTLKRQWLNLPWQEQEYNFLSREYETDGRKLKWYIAIDEKNPDSLIWFKDKGNPKNKTRDVHLISNH